jgi:hypothetical protein
VTAPDVLTVASTVVSRSCTVLGGRLFLSWAPLVLGFTNSAAKLFRQAVDSSAVEFGNSRAEFGD